MILTPALIQARLEMLREQALFIQATKEEERSSTEREWMTWAERRIKTLEKEARP